MEDVPTIREGVLIEEGALTEGVRYFHLLYFSPCEMCTGTALLYKIPHVVVGENCNFTSPGEKWFQDRNVTLELLQDKECIAIMKNFIDNNSDLWEEDIHDVKD